MTELSSTRKQKRVRFLLGYAWVYFVLVQAISGFLKTLFINTQIISIMLFLPLVIGLAINRDVFLTHISVKEIGLLIIILLALGATFLLYPNNLVHAKSDLVTTAMMILYYFLARGAANTEDFRSILWKAGAIGILLMYFSYYTSLFETAKDMTRAYMLLMQVIPVIDAWTTKKKTPYLLLTIAGIVLLFLLGTRGPLVFALLYIVYKYLFCGKHKIGNLLIFVTVTSSAAVFIVSGAYLNVVKNLYSWLRTKNINSLILYQLINDNTASVDARSHFAETLWDKIWDKPFSGYGLWGDRVIVKTYAHNILIEILTQFGIVIGTLILLVLLFLILRTIFSEKNVDRRECMIIVVASCLLKFFVSSSYLSDYAFTLFLGYFIVHANRQARERREAQIAPRLLHAGKMKEKAEKEETVRDENL